MPPLRFPAAYIMVPIPYRTPMPPQRRVVILVFDEAEVLDVCGPYEVFSVAGRRNGLDLFTVSLAAERPGPVILHNGMSVNPQHSLQDCPTPNVLVIPGGYGSRREMHNSTVVDWVRAQAARAELVLSVCTGALILARAGLLDGIQSTTHFAALALLREAAPLTEVRDGVRFIDQGRVVSSAGVSAGLDAALHVVARLVGEEFAEETARYMEYHWDRNEEGIADEGL